MSQQYFETPVGPEERRTVTIRLWGEPVRVETANGVFSRDGLDLGTSVLLRECRPNPSARRVLDLGCGYGPIAIALARALPRAQVDAVDSNPRAVTLTRDNAASLGLKTRIHAFEPDAADPDARYDEIWSNPPIRVGKEVLHGLLNRWLPQLAPDGVARLVVGKNLGADSLQRWLIDEGWDCERTASAKGFRVFAVARPVPDGDETPPPGRL